MIRNGYRRYLQAEVERSRLAEQWRMYPEQVRLRLGQILRECGLHAAHLATEVIVQYAADLEAGKLRAVPSTLGEDTRSSDGQ